MTVRVAAFDFDGTLTKRDTVVPFLFRSLTPQAASRLPAAAWNTVAATRRRDRNLLRAAVTEAVFAGRPIADINDRALRHAERIARRGLRPATAAALAQHQSRGDRVVIVSASYENYVRPLAATLGIDDVIATRLASQSDDDGIVRCTGMLEGPNVRGEEKVVRLQRWLLDQNLSRGDVEIFAYGDSPGDDELLAYADRAFWVPGDLIG